MLGCTTFIEVSYGIQTQHLVFDPAGQLIGALAEGDVHCDYWGTLCESAGEKTPWCGFGGQGGQAGGGASR